MTLLAPARLVLLVPVVALAAAYVYLQLRRRHYAVRFTNLELLDSVAPKRPGWRRHIAATIAGLALVAMVIGLARPAHEARVPREEAVIMLAIDVSRSMTATDVTPSRMESAVAAAADFVKDVPSGFRVGLVAFDDHARLVATPTTDHDAVVTALERLRPGRGTAAGDAIEASLDAIRSALDAPTDTSSDSEDLAASIVLLSDGETTAGVDPEEASADATAAGVPVTTISYGTDGGTVDVGGETVEVPADPVAMKAIADATNGSFFEAASSSRLQQVYRDIQSRIGYTNEQREIVLWFVSIALIALMLALGASMLWTARFV
jgi:Ca-activated chloride channel homolog